MSAVVYVVDVVAVVVDVVAVVVAVVAVVVDVVAVVVDVVLNVSHFPFISRTTGLVSTIICTFKAALGKGNLILFK